MSPRLDVANANNLVTVRVPYLLIFKRYWRPLIGTSAVWCGQCLSIIFPLINLLRFIFDFVAFSNVIFLGAIISSVIHDGDIKKNRGVATTSRLSHYTRSLPNSMRTSVQPFGTSEHGTLFCGISHIYD